MEHNKFRKYNFLVLSISAAVFLVLISPVFCYAAGPSDSGFFSGPLVTCKDNCDFDALLKTINNIIKFLIFLGIVFSSVVMAYVGFIYLTSAGNTSKLESAKGIFWKVIWGIVIMLSAWLIVNLIERSLLSQEFQGSSLLEGTRQ
jgi:hypothetical protein